MLKNKIMNGGAKLAIILLLFFSKSLVSQNILMEFHSDESFKIENELSEKNNGLQEEKEAFHSPVLINSQTSEVLHKKSFEFLYEQRLGRINSGKSEMFGINTPNNIRLGFAYGLTDRVALSIGIIRFHSLVDIGYKHIILKQKKVKKMPFTLTYYGNITTSLENSDEFHKISDRISYINQIIFSRKLGTKLSLFLAPGYMYFNEVEETNTSTNNSFLIASGAKANITHKTSLILEYGKGHLLVNCNNDNTKPGVSFGIESIFKNISFQVFATTFKEISEQDNYMYNQHDFMKGDFLLGFNIALKLNDQTHN
jgi:hypothetical protein